MINQLNTGAKQLTKENKRMASNSNGEIQPDSSDYAYAGPDSSSRGVSAARPASDHAYDSGSPTTAPDFQNPTDLYDDVSSNIVNIYDDPSRSDQTKTVHNPVCENSQPQMKEKSQDVSLIQISTYILSLL